MGNVTKNCPPNVMDGESGAEIVSENRNHPHYSNMMVPAGTYKIPLMSASLSPTKKASSTTGLIAATACPLNNLVNVTYLLLMRLSL
jgi:hypothetical protein